ncbi:MAG: Carboxypeptidase regulatory-like domain [Chloroflexota bacterium]|jgi:hypothetical protein|nr:Carboxypeptidase regulatory-like domain [Chloroflexota bacterium]
MKRHGVAALGPALLLLLAACGPAVPGVPGGGGISGTVFDAAGKPLEGATVEVLGKDFLTQTNVVTKADGKYSLSVPDKSSNYRLAAWIERSFEGETHRLGISPSDGKLEDFKGGDGYHKDFKWQLSGHGWWSKDEGHPADYIGGAIKLVLGDPHDQGINASAVPVPTADPTVELTLTPSQLIDGSRGDVVKRKVTLKGSQTHSGYTTWAAAGPVTDIPIGKYTVTAAFTDGTELLVAVCDVGCTTHDNLDTEGEVVFPPSRTNNRPYQSHNVSDQTVSVSPDTCASLAPSQCD